MFSSLGVFLQVLVEIIKFEVHSDGPFNFSKKDSASRHALETKFILNSPLLFSKRNFSGLCWKNIVAKFYVYSLQPAAVQ